MTRVGNRVTRGRLLPLALLQVLVVLRRGKKVGGGERAHLTGAAVVAVAI